jgi:hypothetical protein
MAEERQPVDRPRQPATAPAKPGENHVRARVAGFVSRHRSVSRVLEWLGVYNPGGSINP